MTEVSVVMSVYNGESQVRHTLMSLEAQIGLSPEIIVVNDGSEDETAEILDDFAYQRSNIHIIHQSNKGLTAALIRGCAAARGQYIARQDSGDISAPTRLIKQMQTLETNPDASMISCATRFSDQEGNFLYEMLPQPAIPRNVSIESPPHHGSVMFRKNDYRQAGGYRPEFYVAQDLDLWSRLQDMGGHICLKEMLYEASVDPGSITSSRRHIQQKVANLSEQIMSERRAGRSEQAILDQIRIVSREDPLAPRIGLADYHYFIAGCLRQSLPERARHHYREAIRANPSHLRAMARYLQLLLKTR